MTFNPTEARRVADKIEIIDIIDHRHQYGEQSTLVLNRMPECVFERSGKWLIGNDGCIYRFYYLEHVRGPSHWKAFGGDEFDIPMADGTVTHANGQWWSGTHPGFRDLVYGHGISTVKELQRCYVFSGGFSIDKNVVDEWRDNNEPSNNYNKYRKNHASFGQHRIISKW